MLARRGRWRLGESMRVDVRKVLSGQVPNARRIAWGWLVVGVLGLGFLWIVWDPERQAWHDRVAGTYVVKVPRAYPI